MKTLSTILSAILALATIDPATAQTDDEHHKVERRVVRVITTDDASGENDNFVFLDESGEPRMIHTPSFFRGGYLGVQLTDLTPELRRHFGVGEEAGIMVSGLSEEGPAATAGVQVGDIVTAIDGEPVTDSSDLARIVRGGEEGQVVELELWRDGRRQLVEVTLAERQRPQIDIGPFVWEEDLHKALENYEVYLDKLPKQVIQIDRERLGRALEEVERKLESGEWRDRIRTMVEERELMEKRLQDLEEHLREVEKRLEKLDE